MPFDPSCVNVEDYLECLEFRNVQKATETEIRFSCPYPVHADGDENPSAYINIETTKFFCHSCHAKGNAVSLAADVLQVSHIEATRMLKQRYSVHGINPDSRSMVEELAKWKKNREKTENKQNKILPESTLDAYKVDWHMCARNGAVWAIYMFQRGFTISELNDWQFGYSVSFDRITLPVRDEDGRLVGIKARAWYDGVKPKYLNLRDDQNGVEPYLKNDVVFGLDRFRKHRNPFVRSLIVVEGEYNVVAMHKYGFTNTVSINGSYFGDKQVRLLKQYADWVILFFDSDTAGRDATNALGSALRPFMPVFVCPEHDGDPAKMSKQAIADCINSRYSFRKWERVCA